MNMLQNENLIKLIFNCFIFKLLKQLFCKLNNRTINHTLLKSLSYRKFYKLLGNTKTFIEADKNYIKLICLLSDGNLLSISTDYTLKVWNMENYQCINTIEYKHTITSLIPLSNSSIACCTLKQLRILDPQNNFNCIKTINLSGFSAFNHLLQLENGYLILNAMPECYSSLNFIIILEGSNDYNFIKSINVCNRTISCLINLDNDRFASASKDGYIRIWSSDDEFECLRCFSGYSNSLKALLYWKYGLLLSTDDCNIKVWDMCDDFFCVRSIYTHSCDISMLLLLPGGYFASCSDSDGIRIWEIADFQNVNHIQCNGENMLLSKLNDNRIVCVSFNNFIIFDC
jgi:WD40 repeat protein